jgi:hypothetical protein
VKVIERTDEPRDPLEHLAGEAEALQAGIDQANQETMGEGRAPAAAAPPVLTNAQCIAMGLQMIRESVCGLAKVRSPKHTLDDATIEICAAAVAPVLDKYGIDLQKASGGYMVEIKAILTVGPILWAARAALIEEVRAMKAKPVDQASAAPAPAAEAAT